jgi:hypothetical protein
MKSTREAVSLKRTDEKRMVQSERWLLILLASGEKDQLLLGRSGEREVMTRRCGRQVPSLFRKTVLRQSETQKGFDITCAESQDGLIGRRI